MLGFAFLISVEVNSEVGMFGAATFVPERMRSEARRMDINRMVERKLREKSSRLLTAWRDAFSAEFRGARFLRSLRQSVRGVKC